jgi:acetyltransferase-like isoleucine patch superfamily enzyme
MIEIRRFRSEGAGTLDLPRLRARGGNIIIEDDVSIGAMIVHGVMLRRGKIVGTNALVTKPSPESSVIADIPAKLLRFRS